MKKYKLIKEYPGSVTKGTVFTADNEINAVFQTKGGCAVLYWQDLEKYSEYFEEVLEYPIHTEEGIKKIMVELDKKHVPHLMKEEPNYLITAFRDLRDINFHSLWKINADGNYLSEKYGATTLYHVLNSGACVKNGAIEIYSVKNPKGEEFTIGDNAFFKTTLGWQNVTSKILKFEILENFILATTEDRQGNIEYLFKDKVEQPLYTTTDGYKIFKGDSIKLYTISKDCNSVYEPVRVDFFVKTDKATAERLLCFTSEENRDNYLEEHTKRYSLADIEKCYPHPSGYENRIKDIPLVATLFNNLKKLGK